MKKKVRCKMEKNPECTCSLCQQGNYNSADYYVDMSFLKKERHLQDYPDPDPDPILSETTKNIIDRDKRCL